MIVLSLLASLMALCSLPGQQCGTCSAQQPVATNFGFSQWFFVPGAATPGACITTSECAPPIQRCCPDEANPCKFSWTLSFCTPSGNTVRACPWGQSPGGGGWVPGPCGNISLFWTPPLGYCGTWNSTDGPLKCGHSAQAFLQQQTVTGNWISLAWVLTVCNLCPLQDILCGSCAQGGN